MKARYLLFGLFLFHGNAFAQDFRWEPGTVKARVTGPDALEIGHYLYISRQGKPDDGHGWNMAKLDLPERWKLESVKVQNSAILLLTDAGSFSITPDNLGRLHQALMKHDRFGGEQELEKIWFQEGGFKALRQ
jgi:hypothetical protein